MAARTGVLIGVLLGAVLVAGVAIAAFTGSRTATSAPLRAAPPVPASGVGPSRVLMSADALGHPAAPQVRAQLQRHYDAINDKDYAAWAATVVAARSAALPEPQWQDAYDSTRDGTIRIDRIDDLEGARVLVRVRFVSTQDVDDAPSGLPERRICWRQSLPMSGEPPLVEQTGAGSSTAQPC